MWPFDRKLRYENLNIGRVMDLTNTLYVALHITRQDRYVLEDAFVSLQEGCNKHKFRSNMKRIKEILDLTTIQSDTLSELKKYYYHAYKSYLK